MRDIDFIPQVMAELAPHFPEIENRFNEENEAYKKLLAQDHDAIGRVLKCHLILEVYINRHLATASPTDDWQSVRLNFATKVDLLPHGNVKIAWVVPGIRETNKIRNSFGHQINPHV